MSETDRTRRTDGKFGEYGGQYVPEALMPAIEELADAYERYVLDNEDGFIDEFRSRLADFGGRPTPLQYADQLSERYDTDIYLKREDLLHGGAHKLNNALGQVLLAKYMGKERIIAETGAGQHGTATAMAAAHLDMPCEIYMGETDIARQRPNVFRMKINGSEVVPVTVGRGTLKEAISETMREWATTVENTHYVIGSVVGPHPFPKMVRDFQAVISEEAREQAIEETGGLPTDVVACAGGGSNTMGTFAEFVPDEDVALHAVEAGGSSLQVDEEAGVAPNSATLSTGDEGVLHGARTKLLQDSDGQIMESHSVSAGLDYAGVGPELVHEAVLVLQDVSLVGVRELLDGRHQRLRHELSAVLAELRVVCAHWCVSVIRRFPVSLRPPSRLSHPPSRTAACSRSRPHRRPRPTSLRPRHSRRRP